VELCEAVMIEETGYHQQVLSSFTLLFTSLCLIVVDFHSLLTLVLENVISRGACNRLRSSITFVASYR